MQNKREEELLLFAIDAAVEAGKAIMKVYASSDFEVTRKSDWSPLTLADKNAHDSIINSLASTELPILSEEGAQIKYEDRKDWEYYWLVDPLDGTKEFIKRNGEFTVNIALIKHNKPVIGVIYVPAEKRLYFGSEKTGAFRIRNYELGIIKNDVGSKKYEVGKELDRLIKEAIKLPIDKKTSDVFKTSEVPLTVIASRSHMNAETSEFIENLKKEHKKINIISKGSSLKLCLIAEGNADIYPRYSPCMEWDTAAGHAIVNGSGGKIIKNYELGIRNKEYNELEYNKRSLINPSFIAYSSRYT
jgi:3'(2'), 5'-bisphosphate nucleotidase